MLLLFFWFAFSVSPAGDLTHQAEPAGVGEFLSRQQYEKLFPHHHSIYTYEAFIKAAAYFPLFAGEGSPELRKRELAAFFAHAAHETTNGGPGAEGGSYSWGLYY